MKYAFLIFLLSQTAAVAQHLVVFAKDEACDVDSKDGCLLKNEAAKVLADLYGKKVRDGLTGLTDLKLEAPPLQWGRKVREDDFGRIAHLPSFTNGLVADVSLSNLVPNHSYRLCLNGRPDLAGNKLLPTPVPGHETERYYDFLTIKTDNQGSYHGSLAILLQPGSYHVRFYVKDTEDFKITLYHDYFEFRVD